MLRYGSASAKVLAETYDIDMVAAMRNETVNPHLRYVDSTANGYGLATFDGDGAKLTLVTIEPPIVDRGDDGAKLRGSADSRWPSSAAATRSRSTAGADRRQAVP